MLVPIWLFLVSRFRSTGLFVTTSTSALVVTRLFTTVRHGTHPWTWVIPLVKTRASTLPEPRLPFLPLTVVNISTTTTLVRRVTLLPPRETARLVLRVTPLQALMTRWISRAMIVATLFPIVLNRNVIAIVGKTVKVSATFVEIRFRSLRKPIGSTPNRLTTIRRLNSSVILHIVLTILERTKFPPALGY